MLKLNITSAFLCFTCICLTSSCQELTISRTDFEVSAAGGIFGAAVSQDAKYFYAQQYLLDDIQAGHHFVQISFWNLQRKSKLATRTFIDLGHAQSMPCRRTSLGELTGNLYTCSSRTSIIVMDGQSLASQKTIRMSSEQVIADFSVNETRDTVYVLTTNVNGPPALISLSISTGKEIRRIGLPLMELAYSPLTYGATKNLLAVSFVRTSGWGQKTKIIIYDAQTLEIRKEIENLPRIDSMFFLGPMLMAVPGYNAYQKQECILGVGLEADAKVSKEFCSVSTGVDFSAAVVGNDYLIAGTGVNRAKLFSDLIESASSSVTIWNIDTRKAVKTLPLPEGYTSALSGFTVLGTKQGCFLAYQSAGVSPHVISGCVLVK